MKRNLYQFDFSMYSLAGMSGNDKNLQSDFAKGLIEMYYKGRYTGNNKLVKQYFEELTDKYMIDHNIK